MMNKKITHPFKINLAKLIMGLAAIVMAVNFSFAQIKRQDPSSNPPKGLTPAQVPQFISLGLDDNGWADGIYWCANLVQNLKNPAGSGQSGTYDGFPARISFYDAAFYMCDSVTFYGSEQLATAADNPDSVKLALNYAYKNGNEIGNHTFSHSATLVNADSTRWSWEMNTCNHWLSMPTPPSAPMAWTATPNTGAGVSVSDIHGFRTPFLAYGGAVFPALKALGFEYDCSIEEGDQTNQDGTNFFWPYTLDSSILSGHYASFKGNINTNPTGWFPIPNVPGLWEVADQVWMLPDDATCIAKGYPTGIISKCKATPGYSWVINKLTGFDYNSWVPIGLTKDEFLAILKYNFDLRYNGNRAPWVFGGHSDIYSPNDQDTCKGATYLERREAIQEFVQYVLSKSDARIVTTHQILEWCKNPVALQPGNGPFTLTLDTANGTVTLNPQPVNGAYAKNTNVTITAVANAGYTFDSWGGVFLSGNTNPTVITMDDNKEVVVNFKKIVTCSDYDNILADQSIVSTKDALGSTISQTLSSSLLTVNWSMPAQSGSNWPWVEVECTSSSPSYEGLCSVEITYKANYEFRVTLLDPTLASGTSFMYLLPASTSWSTVTIQKSQFAQPSWASGGTLNLANVKLLMLVPIDYGATGNIQVNELKAYGLSPSTVGIINIIKNSDDINVYNLGTKSLNIISSKNEKCIMNIYSIDGKLIYDSNINLNEGINTVDLNSSLANGTYVVRLISNNNLTVKKIAIIK